MHPDENPSLPEQGSDKNKWYAESGGIHSSFGCTNIWRLAPLAVHGNSRGYILPHPSQCTGRYEYRVRHNTCCRNHRDRCRYLREIKHLQASRISNKWNLAGPCGILRFPGTGTTVHAGKCIPEQLHPALRPGGTGQHILHNCPIRPNGGSLRIVWLPRGHRKGDMHPKRCTQTECIGSKL